MKIDLTLNREDFKDIFFRDNQGNIFFGSKTKSSFTSFLLFLIVFLSVGFASNFWEIHPTVIVMSFVVAFISFVVYLIALSGLIKRKKNVNLYLKELENFTTNTLEVEEKSLIIKQDTNTTIVKWDSITLSRIMDSYIELIGEEHVLIPKKSMSDSEFESLKIFVERKLK